MVQPSRRLFHYTAFAPRPGKLPVVPWKGSVEAYGADLLAATQAGSGLSSRLRDQWAGLATKLTRLRAFDHLYDLDLQRRGPDFRYEHFVKDPDRLKDLKERVQQLQNDPVLWADLTAPAPRGAGLDQNHLMALLDRLHYKSHGVFQASTPAAPLWWHGQPGWLHAFAPAVKWVEEGLIGMAECGKFPLSESRYRSGQHVLYRGMKSYQEAFPEGVPPDGEQRFALTLQSCSMTPGGSYAAAEDKKHERGHELVIVNPKEVAAVNMKRVIEAGFPDYSWEEAMLPIRDSGLRAVHDQRAVELKLLKDRIEPQGASQLYAQAFELPLPVLTALHRELSTGLGREAPAEWHALLARAGAAGTRSEPSNAVPHASGAAGQTRQQGGPNLA